jgi:hypothetical protein
MENEQRASRGPQPRRLEHFAPVILKLFKGLRQRRGLIVISVNNATDRFGERCSSLSDHVAGVLLWVVGHLYYAARGEPSFCCLRWLIFAFTSCSKETAHAFTNDAKLRRSAGGTSSKARAHG